MTERIKQGWVSNDAVNRVLAKLIGKHQEMGACSMAIIGSCAKSLFVEGRSDVDILVIGLDEKVVSKEIVHWLNEEGYAVKASYDIYELSVADCPVSISYKTENQFMKMIDQVLEGLDIDAVMTPWSIGGVVNDVLLGELEQALILLDDLGILGRIENRITQEKTAWFQKLKGRLKDDIISKIQTIEKYEQSNKILFDIGVMELYELFFRYKCAEKSEFYPGFKHIMNRKYHDMMLPYKLDKLSMYGFQDKDARELLGLIEREMKGNELC